MMLKIIAIKIAILLSMLILISSSSLKKLKSNTCPLGVEKFDLSTLNKRYTNCDQMSFTRGGHGNINFKAQGNNWYIRIANSKKDLANGRYAYWIVIGGWWNCNSRQGQTRVSGPDGKWIKDCTKPISIGTEFYKYNVNFDIDKGSISVDSNEKLLFECKPPNFSRLAAKARFYGFSCSCTSPSDSKVILNEIVSVNQPKVSATAETKPIMNLPSS
jgi:hypothetical protein